MRAIAEVAEEAGVIAVHENEKEIFGDIPRRCLDIVTTVDSPNLRLAWDPANYVQCGVKPFSEGYADLRPHTVYIQIKDARFADSSVVVAGAGDGEVPRRSAPCGRTASTASSPSSRTWARRTRSAASPARTCGPRRTPPSPTSSAAKGSRTHGAPQTSGRRRVALVGAGVIGRHHGQVITQLSDRLELVAVVDPHADRPSPSSRPTAARRTRV